MAVLLVTYDLKKPGRDYKPVHDWLKKFTYCKDLESVWLLDTNWTPAQVRDELQKLIDANDKMFVIRLQRSWAARNFGCGDWLNDSQRNW
jgi:hypothetical protein